MNVGEKAGWRSHLERVFCTLGFVLAAALIAPAGASGHRPHSKGKAAPYRATLLEDADSGKVLYEENADLEWPPASMAKMMLLLVASEQIKAGRFRWEDPVRVSERAAHTGGVRLGLRQGEVHPLGELMKAALIKSANDAAVAVGEKIAGSVEACVRMMNQRARELGMANTTYHTVNGLPPRPGHDVDRTDARDLAIVARALIRETALLRWSGLPAATFDGGVRILRNTNHLVGHFEGCDGLKTGFTFQSGFNVTATAKQGNLRLIAVILGAPSNRQRFAQAARLLQWGFDRYTSVAVLRGGAALPVRVQLRSGPVIQPVAARDVKVVLPKGDVAGIRLEYRGPAIINGPVTSGERLGKIVVRDRGATLAEVGALSPVTVTGGGAQDGARANYGAIVAPASYRQENR